MVYWLEKKSKEKRKVLQDVSLAVFIAHPHCKKSSEHKLSSLLQIQGTFITYTNFLSSFGVRIFPFRVKRTNMTAIKTATFIYTHAKQKNQMKAMYNFFPKRLIFLWFDYYGTMATCCIGICRLVEEIKERCFPHRSAIP